jgi:hypothetical protein
MDNEQISMAEAEAKAKAETIASERQAKINDSLHDPFFVASLNILNGYSQQMIDDKAAQILGL